MSNRLLSLIFTALMAATVFMTGCCCGPNGPCGPGFGGCVTNCNDCEGGCYDGMPMAYGPLQHLTQLRKSLVCGGGCGEVYYGEWQSTPPDACDPCCDDQFVGGAVPCQPFCWRPGAFFGFLTGFYGQRFCEGCGNSGSMCGCGVLDNSCGQGCDSGGRDSGAGGCATCSSNSAAVPNTRIAKPKMLPHDPRTARGQTRYGTNSRSMNQSRYR